MFYTSPQMTQSAPADPITHRDIIERAGGPAALGRAINVDANTTKAWKRLDSIPAAHWQSIAQAEIASLDELAEAAATRAMVIATPEPSTQAEAA